MRTMNFFHLFIITLVLSSVAVTQPAAVSPGSRYAAALAEADRASALAAGIAEASSYAAALADQLGAGSLDIAIASFDGDDQDDPAYAVYKAGYKLILQEKWQDARRKLAEVMSKYAKSKYVDDAQYWIAYSWKQSDQKRAVELYRKFLKEYPKSNYYDDAVADLNRLEHPEGVPGGIASVAPYVVATIPPLPPTAVVMPPVAALAADVAQLDAGNSDNPAVRMKIDALYALTRGKSDEKTFDLLKGIVLDKEQPREMREAALMVLRNQGGRDVSDVFVQVLKTESDEKLKATAIYWLGQRARDEKVGDEKTVALLKQTAQDHGQSREVREAALHALSQMNRPEVFDLFVNVAKTDPDKEVRQSALYAISQAARNDEEKAFQAMKGFALDQSLDPEMREAAFYWIRNFKKGDALDLYLQVAKSDPNVRMRSAALYYIGEAGSKDPEEVLKIYKEFLFDPTQPREVREAVLYSLTRLKTDAAFDLLLNVAKTDPDQRLQQAAIYNIGRMTRDKPKTLATLTSLFESIPKDRTETLNALLYAIANIGTDQAVDFLGRVAKTSDNYELRRTAIYHLGNIGGEKASAVLYDILKAK
jgi:HEAT repeat protein